MSAGGLGLDSANGVAVPSSANLETATTSSYAWDEIRLEGHLKEIDAMLADFSRSRRILKPDLQAFARRNLPNDLAAEAREMADLTADLSRRCRIAQAVRDVVPAERLYPVPLESS